MVLICPNCCRRFSVTTKDIGRKKRFCSPDCRRSYYHNHGNKHRAYTPGDDVLREFECRECGKHVFVVEKSDKRSVYCSQQCEKKYWRDLTRRNNDKRKHGGNLGMSGGMSLGSLIRREARDLY